MTGPDQYGNYVDQRANGPQGWECPRCHTIHAPWVEQCLCPASTITSSYYPDNFFSIKSGSWMLKEEDEEEL